MMKELFLVGLAAGLGGVALGKWGGPIEAKLSGSLGMVPPWAIHFTLVGASAVGVYWLERKVA